MSVNLSFIGGAGWQFFDDNGVILSGGKIYTYVAGTTTPLATYTSRTGLTANTNPIVLDAYGRTPEQVWSTEGLLYKYVVAKSNDVVLRTWDNIGGSVVASDLAANLAASSGSSLVGFLQSGTGAVATTVQTKLRESVSVKDFGAVGDGVADDTAAIQAALAAAGASTYKRTVFAPAGEYITTASLVVPLGVSLIGEGHGFMTSTFTYGSGTMFRKNHNSNAISVTGPGTDSSIAGILQGFCVVSNATTYPTGAGIYIDGVQQAIVQNVVVSRCGGDSFIFGFTNIGNFTTYVTATNCYANTAGTGAAFGVNSKWSRLTQCISDGGAYGFYLGAQAQQGMYTDIHCEFVTNTGIYLTGAGRNKFIKSYIAITSTAGSGITCANVSGTYFNQFDDAHILSNNTAGQVAFINTGTQNTFNKLSNCTIENFSTGYQDGGLNNSVTDTLFYNCKFPMSMGGNYSTLLGNTTQNTVAAGGTWAINHTAGTIGNWTGNYLDGSNANGLINPGVTGVIGNFSGIKARNNTGFVSRNYGQTGAITSGSTISHGLAGTPTAAIALTCYTGGVTSQLQVSALTSTNFTVAWTGTANVQIGWAVNLACDP